MKIFTPSWRCRHVIGLGNQYCNKATPAHEIWSKSTEGITLYMDGDLYARGPLTVQRTDATLYVRYADGFLHIIAPTPLWEPIPGGPANRSSRMDPLLCTGLVSLVATGLLSAYRHNVHNRLLDWVDPGLIKTRGKDTKEYQDDLRSQISRARAQGYEAGQTQARTQAAAEQQYNYQRQFKGILKALRQRNVGPCWQKSWSEEITLYAAQNDVTLDE